MNTRTFAPLHAGAKKPARTAPLDWILVYPRVQIHGVTSVDVHAQTFEAEVQMEFTWFDREFCARPVSERDPEATRWHPGISFSNCADLKESEFCA